jgi:hypothetical protein
MDDLFELLITLFASIDGKAALIISSILIVLILYVVLR